MTEKPAQGTSEQAAVPPELADRKAGAIDLSTELVPEEHPSLILSSSPHIRTSESIESVMRAVALALAPALAGAIVFFGWDALRVTAWCVAGCLVFEALCLWVAGRKGEIRVALLDTSAVVTGLLLALNLPSNCPWWLALAGAFVAMVVAKHAFGGLGANPFNPALVARIFLLIAWPARMTSWPIPRFAPERLAANPDGLTAATPLGVLATDGLEAMTAQFPLWHVLVGNIGGCLGETSALLLLLGGLYLLARGIVRWEIPVSFIATVALLSAIGWGLRPEEMANPLFHVFAGGLFLGAFFMATDYVTSPLSRQGMLVFGIGCGALTVVIRFFGSFPEGVSFAIVIMNALVPTIDRYVVPGRFGEKPPAPPENEPQAGPGGRPR